MKVKEQTCNGQLSGYLVDGNTFFPKENCEFIKQWLAKGNTSEPEFTDKELETQRKQNIYSQITTLEAKTYRPLREQLVGTEEEKLKASTILGELDEQIKALRNQL